MDLLRDVDQREVGGKSAHQLTGFDRIASREQLLQVGDRLAGRPVTNGGGACRLDAIEELAAALLFEYLSEQVAEQTDVPAERFVGLGEGDPAIVGHG
jgi:hypothetical protein